MSHGFIPVMSTPSNRTAPAVIGIRPETTRAIVDLPAPFAPSSATTRPSAIENDTPNSARNGPYPASTSRSSRTGATPSGTGTGRGRPVGRRCVPTLPRRPRPADAGGLAEVRRADRVVLHHLGGRALGDQRAEVEHGDATA